MLAVTLNGKKYNQRLMWLFWAIYFTENLNEKEFRLVGKQIRAMFMQFLLSFNNEKV